MVKTSKHSSSRDFDCVVFKNNLLQERILIKIKGEGLL